MRFVGLGERVPKEKGTVKNGRKTKEAKTKSGVNSEKN